MALIRKLLLVGVGVLALHSLQACSSGTELNPQPLPPLTDEDPRMPGAGSEKTADPNDQTGGTSGSATPGPSKDAGAEGGDASPDAGDG